MTYIFYAILFYLLYRFITGFIIPVITTTSQVKKQFNAMHRLSAALHERRTRGWTSIRPVDQKPKYDVDGEYIKFEEVKD
jgi:hypothetical protein